MLGTTIIAAALTTGDTMSHTIRTTAVVSARRDGRDDRAEGRSRRHPRRARRCKRHRAGFRSGPSRASGQPRKARTSSTASPARSSSRSPSRRRPRVRTSRASSSSPPTRQRWPASRRSVAPTARRSPSPTCAQREVYLNAKAAARAPGRSRRSRRHLRQVPTRSRCACATSSASTERAPPTPLCFSPSFRRSGSTSARARSRRVLVSNRGGDIAGAALSDDVVALLQPVVALARPRDPATQGRRDRRRRRRPATRSCPSSRPSARSRSRPESSSSS